MSRSTASSKVSDSVSRSSATARSRGVSGWVRNRPDGAVEAVFEGEREDVEALVAFCSQGPRGADVERVDVEAESPEGLSGFRVAG